MESDRIRYHLNQLEQIKTFLNSLLAAENALHAEPQNEHERLKEITELRMLLKSDAWPAAVDEAQIGRGDEEMLHRAAAILDGLIDTDTKNKRVLDFGCGAGHVPYILSNVFGAEVSVGFDCQEQGWDKIKDSEGMTLTKDWETVESNKPYDIIIVNDVIDHCEDFDKQLERMKSVKSPSGKIYVKCHPWCSRHGSHLYDQLNKAFAHLVFSEDELLGMGYKQTFTHKLVEPLTAYRKLFKDQGLSIMKEDVVTKDVEIFFTTNPYAVRRIKHKWKSSKEEKYRSGEEFPHEHLSIETIIYTLV